MRATVVASPADAQQSTQPKRLGFAAMGSPATSGPSVAELRAGLREHGWIDGHNIVIEPRYAEGKLERFAQNAAELVQLPVDLFVTGGTPATLALKRATQTIPIVVAAATDPAGTGLVTPGCNVAAFDALPADAPAKQLEVLREVVPRLSRVALVWNDSNPASQLNARRAREAAQSAGLLVIPIVVQDPGQLDTALPGLREKGAQAIFVVADPRFNAERRRIGELTTATGLPSICQERDYADAGCMLAYGANLPSMFRQAAVYVDRILNGIRPADLPIGPPTRFELAVHAGSARAMGFTIPPTVLKRADVVIQ